MSEKEYIGSGNNSNSRKGLANIQKLQPDGTTKPPAAAEKNNKRAVRHGAYSFLTSGVIPCNKCVIKEECDHYKEDKTCEIIKDFQVEKVKEIMDLPHIQPQDATLAQMLARELAFQAIVSKYISKEGLFRQDRTNHILELQPVLKSYWVSVNSAARMCSELGLSPAARVKLKIEGEGFDFAKAMAQTKEVKDAR